MGGGVVIVGDYNNHSNQVSQNNNIFANPTTMEDTASASLYAKGVKPANGNSYSDKQIADEIPNIIDHHNNKVSEQSLKNRNIPPQGKDGAYSPEQIKAERERLEKTNAGNKTEWVDMGDTNGDGKPEKARCITPPQNNKLGGDGWDRAEDGWNLIITGEPIYVPEDMSSHAGAVDNGQNPNLGPGNVARDANGVPLNLTAGVPDDQKAGYVDAYNKAVAAAGGKDSQGAKDLDSVVGSEGWTKLGAGDKKKFLDKYGNPDEKDFRASVSKGTDKFLNAKPEVQVDILFSAAQGDVGGKKVNFEAITNAYTSAHYAGLPPGDPAKDGNNVNTQYGFRNQYNTNADFRDKVNTVTVKPEFAKLTKEEQAFVLNQENAGKADLAMKALNSPEYKAADTPEKKQQFYKDYNENKKVDGEGKPGLRDKIDGATAQADKDAKTKEVQGSDAYKKIQNDPNIDPTAKKYLEDLAKSNPDKAKELANDPNFNKMIKDEGFKAMGEGEKKDFYRFYANEDGKTPEFKSAVNRILNEKANGKTYDPNNKDYNKDHWTTVVKVQRFSDNAGGSYETWADDHDTKSRENILVDEAFGGKKSYDDIEGKVDDTLFFGM